MKQLTQSMAIDFVTPFPVSIKPGLRIIFQVTLQFKHIKIKNTKKS